MRILFLFLFILVSYALLGQDKLYKKDNSIHNVKILQITKDSVKYSKSDKIFVIDKSEITMIIYEDGNTEVFTSSSLPDKEKSVSETKTDKEKTKDNAKAEAEAKAKADAERKANEEAKKKAEADAKAKAEEERKAKAAKAGPSNLFFSLMVPGWGDYKVRENKKPYWLLAAGAYGLIGTGVYFKMQSNKTYQLYLDESDVTKIDAYYTTANNNHHIYYILTRTGAAIWLGDIVLVAVKGVRNKKSNANLSSIQQSFYLGFNSETKSPLLCYKIRF